MSFSWVNWFLHLLFELENPLIYSNHAKQLKTHQINVINIDLEKWNLMSEI